MTNAKDIREKKCNSQRLFLLELVTVQLFWHWPNQNAAITDTDHAQQEHPARWLQAGVSCS